VRVQVAADLNYNRMTETSETFDPDSKVIRSTQTVDQNANDSANNSSNAVSVSTALPNSQQQSPTDANANKSTSARTEETTNYEISKTVKTLSQNGGDVKRLSVAVVVDGATTTVGGKDAYTPRTPSEMKQIEALVKSAMGFDQKRGDQVQISNMAFARIDSAIGTPAPQPFLGLESGDWFKIIEVGILSLTALLMGFFVARPLIGRMFAPQASIPHHVLLAAQTVAGQLPAPGMATAAGGMAALEGSAAAGALPSPKDNMIDISRIEGQVRESSIRKVGEVVQAHPEEALAILRTWLHQPG
jgi:flagellar M-ring protein FliF